MQCQWQNVQCKLCISKYEINNRHQIKISMLMFCTYYKGQCPRLYCKIIYLSSFMSLFCPIVSFLTICQAIIVTDRFTQTQPLLKSYWSTRVKAHPGAIPATNQNVQCQMEPSKVHAHTRHSAKEVGKHSSPAI